jgi:transposase
MDELTEFIQSNPDPRELKRALAVQMVLQGYTYFAIRDVLQVSVGFISKWKQVFHEHGVTRLALQHQGSVGYLDSHQRQTVIAWLKQKHYWNLSELHQYIKNTYAVEFASNQSYYDLFAEAGLSWKKTQKRNPKADPEIVEKKKYITAWLESHRHEIVTGKLVVFFQDECHLLWGDLCGYAWGKTNERIEVPITNERQKQTYYGALNILTQEFFIKDFDQGNSERVSSKLCKL